jgi:hypothetical protein
VPGPALGAGPASFRNPFSPLGGGTNGTVTVSGSAAVPAGTGSGATLTPGATVPPGTSTAGLTSTVTATQTRTATATSTVTTAAVFLGLYGWTAGSLPEFWVNQVLFTPAAGDTFATSFVYRDTYAVNGVTCADVTYRGVARSICPGEVIQVA